MNKYKSGSILLLLTVFNLEIAIGNQLPTETTCGTNEIFGPSQESTQAGLGEYPWAALLEYLTPTNETKFYCNGVLIHSRYVLTSANCVQIRSGRPKLASIRLGEYDTSKDSNCINNICGEAPYRVGFDKTIIHPDFVGSARDRYNDIALIRLVEEAPLTRMIRPVCLASSINGLDETLLGKEAYVSGWGRTNRSSPITQVKQKITLPIIEQETCTDVLKKLVEIPPTVMCAGTGNVPDACEGFAGAGLVRKFNDNYILDGIVSFGTTCGSLGFPNVYTRISSFDNWIRQNIQA